jgi:cytoplasmic iron level regulating protein YaaA (DUF328/UPF0246 family)
LELNLSVAPKNAPLVILLPPSEGKAEGGSKPGWRVASGDFGRRLAAQRSEVIDALRRAGGGDAKLLGVAGKNLEMARKSNLDLVNSPTLPAHLRYTGVVWDHLAPTTMSPAVKKRAAESVLVVSGLLGLVGFDDPIPDYKLKIGASIAPLGKLSSWWREEISNVLNARLAGCWVVDLLPNEHRAALSPTPHMFAGSSMVTFIEKSGKVAGHDAKAAKGLLARHLLESKEPPAKALTSWKHARFRLEVREVSPGKN